MQYYISDIRRIVIVSLSTFVILLAVAIPYHDLIFRHILQPIITHYDGSRLIMTQITEAVTLPLTIGSLLALMGTLPITLFMMWRFIRGALLPEERQWLKKCMIAAIMMFYLGITASVYCIVPMMLNFFQYSTQLRNTHALSNVSVSVYHSIFADVWYTFSNAHCSVRPNTTQHDHAQPTDQSSKNFCCLIICLGHAFNPTRYHFTNHGGHSPHHYFRNHHHHGQKNTTKKRFIHNNLSERNVYNRQLNSLSPNKTDNKLLNIGNC